MNKRLITSLLSAALLGLSGCATYTETVKDAVAARHSGNALSAATAAGKLADEHANDKDTVIFNLEAGAAYRSLALESRPLPPPPPAPAPATAAAAQTAPAPTEAACALPTPEEWHCKPYMDSQRYFSIADEKIDTYEEQAKHSLSSGAVMVVTNPGMVPYRGQAYDKVLASTYQALNYLALGEHEKARASFNKAYNRQADAVAENEKRIEKDKEKIAAAQEGKLKNEEGKEAKDEMDVSKSQQDPKSKAAMEEIEKSLDARIQAYADYVNPFTVFMDALFMTSCSTDKQEQERGAKQFVRVASMAPDNQYLKTDAALAEAIAAGTSTMPKSTYVIFESGEAPCRKEMLIPIPIFLKNETIITQLPLYKLEFNDQFNPAATVTANGVQYSTAQVCSMDSVVAKDFKNNLGTMWLDAFLCASTKALITHQVNKQLGGGWGLAMGLINMVTTKADTRSWGSLPKMFAYARVDTPADKTITITTPDNLTKTVTVPDANVAVVYVKQVQPGSPLFVDSFKLN